MGSTWWMNWHGETFPVSTGGGGGSTALADLTGVQNALSTKSSLGHGHAQSEITDLESTIANLAAQISTKAAGSHTHAQSAITGLESTISNLAAQISTKAAGTHTHAQADVTGLESTIANLAAQVSTKAAGSHSHSDVSTAAAGFCPIRPASISTTFLRSDGTWVSPPSGGSTALADLQGVQDALSTKASVGHTHAQADVTDLTSTLAAVTTSLSTKASLNSGLVPTAQLGSGPGPTLFLRGDQTWAAPAAAPAAWSTARFDFGYANLRMLRVVISDASVQSTTRRIQFQQDTVPDTDDNTPSSDPIEVRVVPGTTQFTAYAWGLDSPVGGIIQASYQVQ